MCFLDEEYLLYVCRDDGDGRRLKQRKNQNEKTWEERVKTIIQKRKITKLNRIFFLSLKKLLKEENQNDV